MSQQASNVREIRFSEPEQIRALLRREGLYSSLLSKWRQQREVGTLAALSKKRSRKPKRRSLEARWLAGLEREIRRP